MSRKLILSLIAIGTLASAALVTGSADAMVANHGGRGGHGAHGGNGHRPPMYRPHHNHRHHAHHRYIWRHGYRYVGYAPRAVVPGPCTCLTKDYTPEGMVVFQDLCTKEMASAPVAGAPAQASEVQAPTNFAGKTYQDYLAANPQAQAAQQKN